MRRYFSLVCILELCIYCSVFFSSCQKEYSYEGGNFPVNETAIYALVNHNDSCTGNIISGKYYKGVQLSQVNAVQLLVDVSTTGSYNLSTSTINGFHFFAAGNFTNIGRQLITLFAVGTPKETGNFDFTPLAASSCSFRINVVTQPPLLGAFNLSGDPGNCSNLKIVGYYISGMALQASNTVIATVDVGSVGAYSLSTDTLDGISFSASGIFTKTGVQSVTLEGAGTPVFARNLTFAIVGGSSKCSFSLAVIDPYPLATYVLESGFGSASPCIYTVNGLYKSNGLLTSVNSVTMNVYVTVPGNFTIVTDTINGLIFSFSGTFINKGSQKVTLAGAGIPVSSGVYTFTPQIVGPHPLGGESCAFTIDVL